MTVHPIWLSCIALFLSDGCGLIEALTGMKAVLGDSRIAILAQSSLA
jgi:hypothetical protein